MLAWSPSGTRPPTVVNTWSIGPATSKRCATWSASDPSATTIRTLFPSCAATSERRVLSRPAMTTLAPFATAAVAVAKPIPELPPNTTMVLPARLVILHLRSGGVWLDQDHPVSGTVLLVPVEQGKRRV